MISLLVFNLLPCRKAVEEENSDPGSAGGREAMSDPGGAVETLSGQTLLPLEIQQLV